MPKSLDPKARITFTLASDMELPEATRPRLVGRVLTAGPYRVLMQVLTESGSHVERIDGMLTAVMEICTGWENMIHPETGEPIPFTRENLGEFYSTEELGEIISACFTTVDDKKKSESPPLSDAENSASPAGPDAKT